MCGIAGFVGDVDPVQGRDILGRMVRAIERRGPDGEGVEQWPGAWLGHRRLAIIDLSEAGHQPMLSDDRSVGIVFNGCIYNFQEIRAELEQLGHRFRSQCDTEVLVKGYQQWGVDKLMPRLRGMFAFGIWDNVRKTLTLVRDRLGVKPLHYAVSGRTIGFASTVTALRDANLVAEMDPEAVLEFLEFGYITDARSIFKGAVKVPAATIVEWKDGKLSQRTYWTLGDADENSKITFAEAVEETERILIESVKLRLISDVPIGALLSGGIDSTLVCWAMSKLNANALAFTVSTPGDPAADEAPAAREIAKILDIPHRVVPMPLEEDGMLDEVTSAFGEPFGAQSAIAMLRVSAAVKPHATVLLTGDGGDDLFLGYWFYPTYLKSEQIARRIPGIAGSAWRAVRPVVSKIPALRRPKHFADYITGGLGGLTRAHDGLPFYERRGMLGENLENLQLMQRQIPLTIDSGRNMLRDLLQYQQRTWFVSEFMTKVDAGTMHHALEARAPFLDQQLWEFAAKLPPRLRLHGGELKAILRTIVRNRVSPEIANRKKQGFTIPVERWLAGHWGKSLRDMAANPLIEQEGWVRKGSMKALAQQVAESGLAQRQVWFMMVLESWMRHAARPAEPAVR